MNLEYFMKKCIQIAEKSSGHVSPNPLVGCVIVDDCGNLVSQGRHKKYAEAHAEYSALKKAGAKAKNATLFVNLEPCNHHGKTPPCSKFIIKAGIKKVVIGNTDPNVKAMGGIEALTMAGIDVKVGILEEECRKLNEIFFCNFEKNKPFIAIKTATTLDGKVATKTGASKWISCKESRLKVHRLRNRYDAIITSSTTVINDNPAFTSRIPRGRNPIRVIVDRELKTLPDSKVYFTNTSKIYVATDKDIPQEKMEKYPEHVNFIKCPLKEGHVDLNFLMKELFKLKICSILVEAGGIFSAAMLKTNKVDKIYQFIAPKIIGEQSARGFVDGYCIDDIDKALKFEIRQVEHFDKDVMLELYPQ
ncbi:MAG: bifunctional diaminohydroxyphosphoribosylaminopyrimidine deaminase/5-amino-6-(5-phosphoribosylamino)uracil reductase RibD [Candidatus Gastranaerophilales bacterium]|nr:bifunctional diaminohydroxyphosphoribosylaminopyrimidine deaminase/5-amino-6-(5-phosphoribosylamino)uracil reductase RibD [Candidatus Gastranaerophilales bacterium]